MRRDNHCSRCGKSDESVNHAIYKHGRSLRHHHVQAFFQEQVCIPI